MDLWLIFLTGLTVGGLTCLAVQGGLLASVVAARENERLGEGGGRIFPVSAFLVGKLLSHILLGLALGWFGSRLTLSDSARIVIQIMAGLYMIFVALNLLNIHPIFRYVILQPPRFLTKLLRNESKSRDLFAPLFLGILTIFIPCGTTLAMEALAISSGNPILGALIMGVFVLGTFPLFFGVGFLTSFLGQTFKKGFLSVAAIIVLYLGFSSINGALVLADSPLAVYIDLSGGGKEYSPVKAVNGVQTVDITVYPNGYNPRYIQLQSGVPARLNLTTQGGVGCTSQFRIPSLGIAANLQKDKVIPVEFTPNTKGKITWTCSMGMYTGEIEVI